ncbi:MAG TPA: hypothetical protein VKE94_18650 [Gemmataceae bacterium]|nr:hypothetical protein [Gemmataceae bacterium]
MAIGLSELNTVAPLTPTPRELAQAIRAGFESRRYLASVAFGPSRAASVVTGSRNALVAQADVAAYPAVARPGPLAAVIRGLRRIVLAFIRPWLAVQTDYNRMVNEILEIHGAEIATLNNRIDRLVGKNEPVDIRKGVRPPRIASDFHPEARGSDPFSDAPRAENA